ncbi:YlqD family protein [Halobacillus locisalis]|uniref:YlqD family protein n=1 Tax=Halobacillus locisalis TaxID=220753 RepID=A0A838CR82_9BACI|nr:YlqD family protein [Halobacillus locisalis]MBA2174136.1 YlqD family protein [Halobacillus locisalis]
MQIIQKVTVKHILTASSRKQLRDRFDERAKQLNQECRQLEFEQKKLERKPELSRQEVSRRFSKEISKRKDRIRWMEHQLEQLNILSDGSELETDEVEALVHIEEGDSWSEIQNKEIVIQDGKVIRAR